MLVKAYPFRKLSPDEQRVALELAKKKPLKSKLPRLELPDGRVAILQNPKKSSLWATLANMGHTVVQIVAAPSKYPFKYLGVIVNDTFIDYKEAEIDVDRAHEFRYGNFKVTAYYKGSDPRPVAIKYSRE